MAEDLKKAVRIQTSLLNAAEKKTLVWLAERQPAWITSDHLTFIGFIGSIVIALGYILSNLNINWLWLSCLGFLINWYGDSLDGTLARVRNTQRPIYGYYLDHTMDAINEVFMFIGVGLAPFCNMGIALSAFIAYLLLTLNVSIDAHLKHEFKLTYLKMGPTEFRILMILINILIICIPALQVTPYTAQLFDATVNYGIFDCIALTITALLWVIYLCTLIADLRDYARIDPPKKWNKK